MYRNQILFLWLLNLEMLDVINIPEDHSRAPSDLSWWLTARWRVWTSRGFRMQMVVHDRTFAKPSREQMDDGVRY